MKNGSISLLGVTTKYLDFLGSPGPYPTGVEGVDGVEGEGTRGGPVLIGLNDPDFGTEGLIT